MDTGRQAGRRVLGRSPGDCFGSQSLESRRSWPRAFRPQRPFQRTFGQWLISQSRPGHSARKLTVSVHSSTNVRSPGERPSSFPLGTPSCSHYEIQRLWYGGSCREGQGPLVPIHRLAGEGKGEEVKLTMSWQFSSYISCCNEVWHESQTL